MVRFHRFSKTLALAAALGLSFALGAPQAASADHGRGGFWLPFPPPPPFFFPRPVVVHRHGPYCGHYGHYDRYERYDDRRHERHERYERHERHERRDRYGRW